MNFLDQNSDSFRPFPKLELDLRDEKTRQEAEQVLKKILRGNCERFPFLNGCDSDLLDDPYDRDVQFGCENSQIFIVERERAYISGHFVGANLQASERGYNHFPVRCFISGNFRSKNAYSSLSGFLKFLKGEVIKIHPGKKAEIEAAHRAYLHLPTKPRGKITNAQNGSRFMAAPSDDANDAAAKPAP